MKKETFLFGYASLSVIQERYGRTCYEHKLNLNEALGKGVVFYNRRNVLYWALEEQKKKFFLLKGICIVAAEEGKIDLLDEVWDNVNDCAKRYVFQNVDQRAVRCGMLNVLKWFDTKGLSFKKERCAKVAARHGHLDILQWLQKERGLELDGESYNSAVRGDNKLNVMKWLREQGVPWDDFTFRNAAEVGNFEVLRWLHDEGCPWPEYDYLHVYERELKPETLEWLLSNGYRNRIIT